jgi:hypothetical protein
VLVPAPCICVGIIVSAVLVGCLPTEMAKRTLPTFISDLPMYMPDYLWMRIHARIIRNGDVHRFNFAKI